MAIRRKRDKENIPARKLRVSLVDDQSHEQIFSLKATKSNLIAIITSIVALVILLTYCLTAFTGIRHTIPGYPSEKTRMAAIENKAKVDSLEKVIDTWNYYAENIRRIVNGQSPLSLDSAYIAVGGKNADTSSRAAFAANDSLLREEIKAQEQFDAASRIKTITRIEGINFFPPVKGVISKPYSAASGHRWIEIAGEAESMACSILDGTVINCQWEDPTKYSVTIQHSNNIISIFRNLGHPLKKPGDKVTAGTPIAVISDYSGKGPHLLLELWHEGAPVDPESYIKF